MVSSIFLSRLIVSSIINYAHINYFIFFNRMSDDNVKYYFHEFIPLIMSWFFWGDVVHMGSTCFVCNFLQKKNMTLSTEQTKMKAGYYQWGGGSIFFFLELHDTNCRTGFESRTSHKWEFLDASTLTQTAIRDLNLGTFTNESLWILFSFLTNDK